MDQLLLLLISFVANLFSALSGGGAGLLQLPVLIFLGLPFALALSTHKVATVALGIGATVRHLREGSLEWSFALMMLLSGLPGVIVGANIILFVPGRMAEIALGLLTLGLGFYSVVKKQLGQQYQPKNTTGAGLIKGSLGLFFLGVINGSLTSGTGLFVTLWLIRWFGLDYRRAVTYTLVLVGIFWNGTGAVTLGLQTPIKWDWVPALVVGSLLGGYLGAHLAITKGNRWIKHSFEIVTILVGLKLVIG